MNTLLFIDFSCVLKLHRDRMLVSDERCQHSPKCNNKKNDAADGDSQTANMLFHVAIWQQRPLRCANLSNLAAVVGSGLLTRLLLVSGFAVEVTRPRDFLSYALFTFVKASATSNPSVHYCHVECPKKILLYHFLLRWSIRYNARNIPAKSTPPMYLLYSFTIAGQDTSSRWRVLQSVSSNRSDGRGG
ncbi:hypothetical protein T06_17025 [Trichinella sp. T6]|nr:hypothetical protein T06_17025 [Trichinella sp. T6]